MGPCGAITSYSDKCPKGVTAEILDQPAPVVCARAGFHRDGAARLLGEEAQHLVASQLLAKDNSSVRSCAMCLEHVLREIPHHRKTTTLVIALSVNGIAASMVVERTLWRLGFDSELALISRCPSRPSRLI